MTQLIRKAQKGDAEAFGQLFAAYEADLYRMIYLQVKHEADALDVMQETAYRAFKGIRQLKQPEYFKTWLIRIGLNCAADHLRKSGSVLQLIPEYVENTEEYSTQEEAAIIRRATLEQLMTVLTPEEKNIVMLRYYQEYSFREISSIFNQPLGTVKTALYRALNKLRAKAKEDGLYEQTH